jgi:hypothetical protein
MSEVSTGAFKVQSQPTPEAAVVSKALTRAAKAWDLTHAQLGEILGLSEATVSRLHKGDYTLDLRSKAGQCALALLRIYRSLDTLVGGDDAKARLWLTHENAHLHGVPLELMADVSTLGEVLVYVDAMRGKV